MPSAWREPRAESHRAQQEESQGGQAQGEPTHGRTDRESTGPCGSLVTVGAGRNRVGEKDP